MFELKNYQDKVLKHLKEYFILCNGKGAKQAFQDYTGKPYYEISNLKGLPYICLRVPTGGGKTVLASHSIGIVRKEYLKLDSCVVLWIVPTNQIKNQTLNALKDKKHPYRIALETTNDCPVEIMDLQEAMLSGKEKFDQTICIVVTTMAALRIEDIEGRKIYESNGYLMNHFVDINEIQKSFLEKGENGEVLYSLANVFKMRRPIVIIDEAHNARTPLSFDSLKRFSPSAIIEFTATPQRKQEPERGYFASNVLHSVSASELKAEGMIKMPIYLETNSDWHNILQKSILKREELEQICKEYYTQHENKEYIRPILLIQAQPRSQTKETLTVEKMKNCLIKDFNIPDNEIKIQTGEIKELGDINLFSDNCDVRYIITVQALQEGWDCSFAYVLCSTSDIASATVAEQLTGRILRLPNTQFKPYKELNAAYAYVVSEQFHKTLSTLGEGLIENGFKEYEVENYLIPKKTNILNTENILVHKLNSLPKLNKLNENIKNKISFDSKTKELKFNNILTEQEINNLIECVEDDDKDNIKKIHDNFISTNKELIQEENKEVEKPDFKIPYLAIKVQGQLEIFQDAHFSNVQWDILQFPSKLNKNNFISKSKQTNIGKIEVNEKGDIEYQFLERLQGQLSFFTSQINWTKKDLIYWLDKNIIHFDISQSDFIQFIEQIIDDLINNQNVDLKTIVYYRFTLRTCIENLINTYRKEIKQKNYQKLLCSNNLLVNKDFNFTYNKEIYPANWIYNGPYTFKKHYYNVIGELDSKGEEFECACYIDSLDEVEYWVRNLALQPLYSFWLQTSTDKFYPDFIVKLKDGRILIVEYKGEVWREILDSDEKNNLGEIWAKKSNGQCLFIMANKNNLYKISELIKTNK